MKPQPAPGDRVLTVRDPWAHLLVTGAKPVENRTWAAAYQGPVWIHSAARYDPDGYAWLLSLGIDVPDPRELPSGIIGRVDLTGCFAPADLPPDLRGHWSVEGPICWLVTNPVRLAAPIPCRGRLGLWKVPSPLYYRPDRAGHVSGTIPSVSTCRVCPAITQLPGSPVMIRQASSVTLPVVAKEGGGGGGGGGKKKAARGRGAAKGGKGKRGRRKK